MWVENIKEKRNIVHLTCSETGEKVSLYRNGTGLWWAKLPDNAMVGYYIEDGDDNNPFTDDELVDIYNKYFQERESNEESSSL